MVRVGGQRRGVGIALACAACAFARGQPQDGGFGPTIDPPAAQTSVPAAPADSTVPYDAARPPIESSPLGAGVPTRRGAQAPRPDRAAERHSRDAAEGAGLTRVVLALAGVVGLALIAGLALRSVAQRQSGLRAALGAGGRAPAGVLEVLGRYPVASGATLVLLKLDRRVLLLSQTGGGRLALTRAGGGAAFSTLCEITDPDEVASILVKTRDAEGDSVSERFRTLLSRFDRGMDIPDGGIPVVDLTRREAGPVSSLRRRLDSIRRKGGG